MQSSEINALGQSLRRIDRALLNNKRTTKASERIWYQGGEPYFDVFVEQSPQLQLVWFQITLRGRSISWHHQGDRWQTGHTNELRLDDLSMYPASKVIESDHGLDRQFFEIAEAILQCRAGEAIFDQILTVFQQARAQALV